MKNPNKQIAFTSIAALGAASTASAVLTHVSSPVELANDGDTWFLEGAGGSTSLARIGVSSGGPVAFQDSSGGFNAFQFAESGTYSSFFVKALLNGNAVSAGIFDAGGGFTQERYAFNEGTLKSAGAWAENFDLSTQAYAGFRFNTGGGIQYGWVSLTWQNDGDLILNEWAYGDVGDSINVGQLPAAVPESETVASALGLLALGAAGMRRYQNRKRQSATA